MHEGSDYVMFYFRNNSYIVSTLRYFVHVDDEGRDQGANVRQKAREIVKWLATRADVSTSRGRPGDARSASDARRERAYTRDENNEYVGRRERTMRHDDEGATLEDRNRLLEWVSRKMQEEEEEERAEALEKARKKLEEEEMEGAA